MSFEPGRGGHEDKELFSTKLFHSLFPVTLQHLLLVSQLLLIIGVVEDESLGSRPEHADVLHVHIKVQVSSHQLRVLVLVLLVRVESSQLRDEDGQIVLNQGITVDQRLE